MRVKLPVFDLYPQQKVVYDNIITHKKNYAVVLAHRRYGKDFLALSIVTSYALMNRGNYYYFAPYLKQIKEIILLGKLQDEDGTSFLDLIPDEVVKFTSGGKKVNMSDMSIELVNGSIIFFRGSDDDTAQVGAGAKGVIFTEFDMVKKIFYKKIAPMITASINNTGKGFMLFISTPRHKNGNMANLFKTYYPRKDDDEIMKRVKKRWLLRFLNVYQTYKHDGSPMVSKEAIEEAIMQLGKDEFDIEYGLSFLGSLKNVWYGQQLADAETERRIREFGNMDNGEYVGYYWKGQQTYVSWDFGVKDFTDLWFYQINPKTNKPRYILHHRANGYTLDYYIDYIKRKQREMGLGYLLNIVPHDGAKRLDVNGSSAKQFGNMDRFNVAVKRVDYLIQQGLNVIMLDRKTLGEDKWRVINRINTVRKEFVDLEIDDVMCNVGIEFLRGYVKKYSKALGEYIDIPDHDANENASDCADSFSVGIMYYVLFIKNQGANGNSYRYDYDAGSTFDY